MFDASIWKLKKSDVRYRLIDSWTTHSETREELCVLVSVDGKEWLVVSHDKFDDHFEAEPDWDNFSYQGTWEDLEAWVASLEIFRHFRNGHLYRKFGAGLFLDTAEEVVIYEALYGDFGVWVRPKEMFFETIDGVSRFEKRTKS